jgi:hypothetical protein
MKKNNYKLVCGLVTAVLACLSAGAAMGQVSSTWVGDTDGYGSWDDPNAWNPMVVPNNGNEGNDYNVTVPRNPNSDFTGPAVTVDVTIDNLTLVDRALINGAILVSTGVGYSLTVLGTTDLTVVSPDQDTGIIQSANATFTLGTLTNYDSSTKTLMSGGMLAVSDDPSHPAVTQWHDADVVTNNGYIALTGVNANLRDQDTGTDALANFAINNGSFALDNGHVLSTQGDGGQFVNHGFISLNHHESSTPLTVFDVSGDLTNDLFIFLSEGAQLSVAGVVTNNYEIDLGEIGNDNAYRLFARRLDIAATGLLRGSGPLSCNTFSQGRIAPGHSAGQISIQGALILQSPGTLQIEIGGISAGTGFDQVVQQGVGTILGGTLEVSLIDGFENSIQNTDTFDVLTSSQTLNGSFDNVASGARLITTDGFGSFRVNYSGQTKVTLSDFLPPPQPVSLVSRKIHGAVQGDLSLPLSGTPGIEPRSGGASGLYQMIIDFPNSILALADVTLTGTGNVDNFSVNGSSVTVNLSGVANAQTIVVTLVGADDGTNSGNVPVSMSVLIGDTSGNGTTGNGMVNSTDVSQIKAKSGTSVSPTNFIWDITVNGEINSSDVALAKSKSGTGLSASSSAKRAADKSRALGVSTTRR